MKAVDISADVGESFGRWKLGFDEELMEYISSANIACGFHAGDPMVMRNTIRMAIKHGVKLGTHVGFPDLLGFGRRRMAVTPPGWSIGTQKVPGSKERGLTAVSNSISVTGRCP